MARLEKMLPAMGFVIAVALVGITSAFKDAPKGQQNPFWVLKNPANIGSTTPADYQQGSNDCSKQIHFCGFSAPDNGSGEPNISAVTNLTTDLNDLASDNDGHYDQSMVVTYQDNE